MGGVWSVLGIADWVCIITSLGFMPLVLIGGFSLAGAARFRGKVTKDYCSIRSRTQESRGCTHKGKQYTSHWETTIYDSARCGIGNGTGLVWTRTGGCRGGQPDRPWSSQACWIKSCDGSYPPMDPGDVSWEDPEELYVMGLALTIPGILCFVICCCISVRPGGYFRRRRESEQKAVADAAHLQVQVRAKTDGDEGLEGVPMNHQTTSICLS